MLEETSFEKAYSFNNFTLAFLTFFKKLKYKMLSVYMYLLFSTSLKKKKKMFALRNVHVFLCHMIFSALVNEVFACLVT